MNSNLPENAVPVEEAKQWTKRWRQSCPGNCSSFLIPSVDLVEVLFEMAILNGAKIGEIKTSIKRKIQRENTPIKFQDDF